MPRGTLSGTVVTKMAKVPALGNVDLWTVDENYSVLTEACVAKDSSGSGAEIILGTSVATDPSLLTPPGCTGDANAQCCHSYSPGLHVPAGTNIRCTNPSAGPNTCLITGIASKR